MRICLVYDCLYPWTVGGAERRMRELAEKLVERGHDVTYLTRLQWTDKNAPDLPGVRVIAVSRDEPLYGPDGNRTIREPLRFGFGVLKHLLRHGRDYDVVHTVSFPYFSLLAAGAARRRGRYTLISDWYEVWSPEYWKAYVGGLSGIAARHIQRACARIPQRAFVYSQLHGQRLRQEGLVAEPTKLWGEWAGPLGEPVIEPAESSGTVVFAGRHIVEKQAPLAAAAIIRACQAVPGLTGTVLGDGPERNRVIQRVLESTAEAIVEVPGFVDSAVLTHELRHALCVLAPTRREGYGLIVVEAASMGVPVILARGPDNAATELVDDGVNGFVCPTDSVEDLADAIVRVHQAGPALRRSTLAWYVRHLERVREQDPLQRILDAYAGVD